MLSLFRSNPLLDETTTQWLYDCYAWALRNMDSKFFHQETLLVTPTNEHFPGRVDSAEKMVEITFERVRTYAGMQNWPVTPATPTELDSWGAISEIRIEGSLRGADCRVSVMGETDRLPIAYDPQQARQPDRLIALFARELASHLVRVPQEPPPGGEEYKDHATDVIAIFLGFGVFMANNAFTMGGGGCSGCGKSPQALGNLMEDEMTYALAIFCALKGIKNTQVLPHLKAKLRPHYKKAAKEISNHGDRLSHLSSLAAPPQAAITK